MGHVKDRTGERFERLVALEYLPKNSDRRAKWRCICDCGNEAIIPSEGWGRTKSCGCAHKDTRADLSGERFGKLLAVQIDEESSTPMIVKWFCECDCGNIHIARRSGLTSGKIQSCGRGSCRSTFKHGLSKSRQYKSFMQQKREAAKKQRTPLWADINAIKEFYLNVPEGYEVDHIVPIQGTLASGLHVVHNLQYLTRIDNIKKRHFFVPEISVPDKMQGVHQPQSTIR